MSSGDGETMPEYVRVGRLSGQARLDNDFGAFCCKRQKNHSRLREWLRHCHSRLCLGCMSGE